MGSFSFWHWLIVLIIFIIPLLIGLLVMGAQKKVLIKHKQSGLVKSGYVGYCWTYYFIGWIVPIIRGELTVGLLHLIFTLFTFGIFQLIMPFLYNKQHLARNLTNGWDLSDTEELNAFARHKLGITI